MSMVPDRDPICPVCGRSLGQVLSQESHLRHECSGPRISWQDPDRAQAGENDP